MHGKDDVNFKRGNQERMQPSDSADVKHELSPRWPTRATFLDARKISANNLDNLKTGCILCSLFYFFYLNAKSITTTTAAAAATTTTNSKVSLKF